MSLAGQAVCIAVQPVPPKTIEAIAALYRSDAERYWNSTLATIERVKHTYRAKKSETPDPVIRPYALMLMYASISF
nr:hypothetical protein [Escherichia coli]